MVRASLLQTLFSRGPCKSQTRTKSRPGPRALSLLCPCDAQPPMCTPCIHKQLASNMHRWEAPAGALIWGWSEVPGLGGSKRRIPGYPPFAGEGRPTSAHSLDSSSTLAPPGHLSPGKTVLCLSMILRHEDQRGKEVEVRELPLEDQNDPKTDL